jgi:hypothetical protein
VQKLLLDLKCSKRKQKPCRLKNTATYRCKFSKY